MVSGVRYTERSNKSQAWIIKVNGENGDMLWQTSYGGESLYSYTNVGDLVLSDGAYYLTGSIGSSMYVVRFDDAGKKTWDYLIPPQDDYYFVNSRVLYVGANHDIYLFGVKNNDQSKASKLFMTKLKE